LVAAARAVISDFRHYLPNKRTPNSWTSNSRTFNVFPFLLKPSDRRSDGCGKRLLCWLHVVSAT